MEGMRKFTAFLLEVSSFPLLEIKNEMADSQKFWPRACFNDIGRFSVTGTGNKSRNLEMILKLLISYQDILDDTQEPICLAIFYKLGISKFELCRSCLRIRAFAWVGWIFQDVRDIYIFFQVNDHRSLRIHSWRIRKRETKFQEKAENKLAHHPSWFYSRAKWKLNFKEKLKTSLHTIVGGFIIEPSGGW